MAEEDENPDDEENPNEGDEDAGEDAGEDADGDDDDDDDDEKVGGGRDDDEDDDDEEDGEGKKKPFWKRRPSKKFIIIVGAALLLLIGSVTASFFFGLLDPVIDMVSGDNSDANQQVGGVPAGVYHDFPELIIPLRSKGRIKHSIKLRFTVELKKAEEEEVARIDILTPKLIEKLQSFVGKLSARDLNGAHGVQVIRQHLLTEIPAAFAPIEVNDILITDFIIQ